MNKNKLLLKLSVIIVGLGILSFAYIYSLKLYEKEKTESAASFSDSAKVFASWMEIYVDVVDIDPIKGEVKMRLDFTSSGELTNNGGATPNKKLKLYVNNNVGSQEYNFDPDKLISPIEITTSMHDGRVADYPFDSHKAELLLILTTPRELPDSLRKTDSLSASIQDSLLALSAEIPVDIKLEFNGAINGINLSAYEQDLEYEGMAIKLVNMDINRAKSVKGFSLFIMCSMIAITLILLILIYSIIFSKRKVGLELFAFAAALLFALPALRDVQPGVPSIGSLIDFIAFFWAEGISAILLIISAIIWLIKER